MERLGGWQHALNDFIATREYTPFEWGTHDCSMFCLDAAEVMTGMKIAEEMRGYSDLRGALAKMYGTGERTLAAAAAKYSDGEVPLDDLRPGDWVWIPVHYDTWTLGAMGVCIGSMAAFAGPSGLSFSQIEDLHPQAKGFKVG